MFLEDKDKEDEYTLVRGDTALGAHTIKTCRDEPIATWPKLVIVSNTLMAMKIPVMSLDRIFHSTIKMPYSKAYVFNAVDPLPTL